MTDHTKGSWERHDTADYAEIIAGGHVVAMVARKADANLIAAAPDLLAAAKLLEVAETAHVNCPECEGEEVPELCPRCFPAFDEARIARRLAITKATPK